MASLKDLKLFFESGQHGRKMPLAELKELSLDEKNELRQLLDLIPEEDR